jgi:hypothetical protein
LLRDKEYTVPPAPKIEVKQVTIFRPKLELDGRLLTIWAGANVDTNNPQYQTKPPPDPDRREVVAQILIKLARAVRGVQKTIDVNIEDGQWIVKDPNFNCQALMPAAATPVAAVPSEPATPNAPAAADTPRSAIATPATLKAAPAKTGGRKAARRKVAKKKPLPKKPATKPSRQKAKRGRK